MQFYKKEGGELPRTKNKQLAKRQLINKKVKKFVHAVINKNSENVEINSNDYERIVFVFIAQVVTSE